jgi:RND family efflux transporter MFP subunit
MKTPATFLLATLILFSGCKYKADNQTAPAPIPVETVRVEKTMTPRLCEVPGTVVPKEKAIVSARTTGIVDAADFALGQQVKKGQVILTISAPELIARVGQAQGSLDKAKRDCERETSLLTKGASTPQTVKEMQERLRIAEASLAEAKTLESYTRAEAPFEGRITRKFVNAGDYSASGTPLFEIEGNGALRVEASVPESFPNSELGATLKIRAESGDCTGILAEFSPAADTQSRTRTAKVDVPDGSPLRSGQFVRLTWPVGSFEEVLVPESAVSSFGQIQRVFIVENGKALLRVVRTGESNGGHVQILSGLSGGEILVVRPPSDIANGQPVKVR